MPAIRTFGHVAPAGIGATAALDVSLLVAAHGTAVREQPMQPAAPVRAAL